MDSHEITMEKIVSLCKRRGFVFQSSEIYGGQAGAWDYGPIGIELKKNIQNAWWKEMTQLHDNIVGLDAAILMHPRVWEASGHVANFSDPLVDCKQCKMRYRADTMDQDALAAKNVPAVAESSPSPVPSTSCLRPTLGLLRILPALCTCVQKQPRVST